MPGVSNVVADALSRPPDATVCSVSTDMPLSECFSADAIVPVLDHHCLATDQLVCLEMAALCASSSLHFSRQYIDRHTILGNISTRTFRPVVPQSFRQQVFETIHNIAHPGTRPPNVSS